jgi:hypothetical protein
LAIDQLEFSMNGDNLARLGEGNWRDRERDAVDRQLYHRRRLGSGRTVFVKRTEDKRVWLIRLQEAASDLATTSYL